MNTCILIPTTLAFALISTPLAHSATLAEYTFTGGSSADSATATNVTVSTFTIAAGTGSGFSSSSGTVFLRSTGTASTLAGAIDANDYVEFNIEVAEGFSMDLSSLSFEHKASAALVDLVPYESNFSTFTSVDGFAEANVIDTSTATHTSVNGGATTLLRTASIDLTSSTFQDLTGTTTFRIYGFDDKNANDAIMRLDNVTVFGAVTAVPEPSTISLISLGGVSMLLRKKRD